MSKVFMLTQANLDDLLTRIDRDPQHGFNGGSSDASVNDPGRREVYDAAHRFYNYQIRQWLDEVSK